MQLAGAWTSSSKVPVGDCGVTEVPEAAVSLTAGVAPGEPPAGTTKTSNAGPEAGAGVHRYAHPMFHPLAATVNGVLVQAPLDCLLGMSTWATPLVGVGPAGAVVADGGVDADDGADEVVGEDAWPAEPAGGGGVYDRLAGAGVAPPPPVLPMTIPRTRAIAATTASCQVRHDRRSLMPKAPGTGAPTGRSGVGPPFIDALA
jgi:hypothetical protein